MSEDYSTTREHIIASLFRKVKADGVLEDTYVTHVKIWEDVPAGTTQLSEVNGMKPRYIMVAVSAAGVGNIYKGKRNTNGSFSVGKTWSLDDLKGIEVVDAKSFKMTINRTYKWYTEREAEQTNFAIATAHLFARLHPGQSLKVSGISLPQVPPTSTSRRSNYDDQRQSLLDRQSQASSSSLPNVSGRRQIIPETDRTSVANASNPPPLPVASPLRRPTTRQTSFSSNGSVPSVSATRNSSPTPSQPLNMRPRTPATVSSLRSSTTSATRFANPPLSSLYNADDALPAPPSIPYLPPTESPRSRSQTPQPPSNLRLNKSNTLLNNDGASTPTPRTPPSPSRHPQAPYETISSNRDPDTVVSSFDNPNQAGPNSLLSPSSDLDPTQEDDYGVEATMANVEEMIDSFEWSAIQVDLDGLSIGPKSIGRKRARGAADQIEARLQDELMALEKANIHSFLESDDRVLAVMKLIDEAVHALDEMDGLLSSYKIQLNAVSDDISFIQSRDRGLQVQTQNQSALLNEIQQLLQTVHVDPDALIVLTQGSLETDAGIGKLEQAAAELYKAMQAARETDMAATMERLDEYRTHNGQFTTRLLGFLSVMFSAQATLTTNGAEPVRSVRGVPYPSLAPHEKFEAYIGRYSGLILYLREMDETKYSKLCGTYYSVASELHGNQMKALMTAYLDLTRRATDDGEDLAGFSPAGLSRLNTQVKRSNTLIRSPLEGRKERERNTGSLQASEAFGRVLGQITPQIYREENFIADFLQINDQSISFADYMGLESYFRRQAARTLGVGQATAKLVRGALDLIFGFLPEALKVWIDGALAKDNLQLVGIMSNLERFTVDAEERGNWFVQKLLHRHTQRLSSLLNRLVDEQIKAVEQNKLTTKKRKGVAHFIKYFPIFVSRIESQMVGADTLEVRGSVDGAYEQIVQVMFESLQQMAKMDGGDAQATEDKEHLNYHVILIENMHYFIGEISQQELGAIQGFLRRAEAIYDENLSAYVKLVMRRPMGKILDYFEGVERLLKTTAPSEVHNNGNYSKSALKRVLKEYSSKEVRRHVEALHKRVDKHFTLTDGSGGVEEGGIIPPGTVMVGVWKACEEEMVRNTETFNRLIGQCYEGSGLALDYTVGEVEMCFNMQRNKSK